MIIAVSKYGGGLNQLDFCENDGKGMHDVLVSLGYEVAEKNLLVGQVNGTQMRDSILDFFDDNTIRSNDVVLFYYSGHGVPDVDSVYLASSDTDPNYPNKRGFSYDELRKMMNRCTSTKIITILDSCYSGALSIGKGKGPAAAKMLAAKLISKSAVIQDEGKCILAASQSYQEAFGTKEGEQSIFTHYLIQGLSGDKDAVDTKGNVTPDTLGKYVYDKVTSIYPNQKPIRKVETSGDIILATFPVYDDPSGSVTSKIKPGEPSFNAKIAIEEANNFLALGQFDKALSKYNQILENEPKNINAWNNKAKVYEKLVMYDEALECFDRAIEINIKDDVLWYNKGTILSKQEKFEDAIRCYDEAIKINQKDSSYWKNKSIALFKIGRNTEAKKCLKTATSLN